MSLKNLNILLVILISSCSSINHKNEKSYPKIELSTNEAIQDHHARSPKSMVVSQGHYATAAGLEILQLGGNAADAAVAVSFTLSVERPQSTGIGGGGFILLAHPSGVTEAWDFRETAPSKIQASQFLKSDGSPDYNLSQLGGLSVATPGLVKGLQKFHAKYGKLPWSKLLQPAIRLAAGGFAIYPELSTALVTKQADLKKFPATEKIFFNAQGEVLKTGELLVQKDLSQTLTIISKSGSHDFYQGSIAKKIVATIKKYQGILSLNDLKNYDVKQRTPVHVKFGKQLQSVDIYSMPPPSSGGIHVLQILNFLQPAQLQNPWTSDSINKTAQAMQQAFSDRAKYLGDPDFNIIPSDALLSSDYAQKIYDNFSDKAKKQNEINLTIPVEKSFETTHFSIIDEEGFAISSTQTINGYFGSSMVAEGTGIVLNNEMDDFAISAGGANLFGAYGGAKNFVQPLKRPLSSMSPTIVMKDGKPFLILGSPSGTRIITCVAQTLMNYLNYQLPLYDSVAMMRFHHQWSPDELWIEEGSDADEMAKDLSEKNYPIKRKDLGCKIQAIAITKKGLEGVSDPRGRGSVLGF